MIQRLRSLVLRDLRGLGRRLTTGWAGASIWYRLLLLGVVLYGTVFTVLTAMKVSALTAYAYDLGLYNQAIHTTLFNGRFFYYTADLPANPSGSLFGAHFSPIFFLLLVPYVLAPSLLTLLVLQTWAIALAALPIFHLGRLYLKSDRTAATIAVVFLLHPATQGVNWFDFHPEAFLLLFMGAGLYFLETKAWRAFFATMVLAMTTIEMAPALVGTVAVGALASLWWSGRRAGVKPAGTDVRVLLTTLVLAIVWLAIGASVLVAVNPHNIFIAGGAEYWSVLGASSLLTVPLQTLLRPDRAVAALGTDFEFKLWYVFILFSPVLFLTFRSRRAMFYCLPWLLASLLSNLRSYYLVGNQYPSFVLPFIFYGAVLGLARPIVLPGSLKKSPTLSRLAASVAGNPGWEATPIVVTVVVVLLVVSPIGPFSLGAFNVGGFPLVGEHERAVGSLYGIIPRGASVLTQNNLFPLVSDRPQAYVIPVTTFFPSGTSFNATMNSWASTVDYILIDYLSSSSEAALVLSWPNLTSRYSVVAAADGALLLHRGSGGLTSFVPYVRTADHGGVMSLNASLTTDSAATGGLALHHDGTATSNFWEGPVLYLPPGSYRVTYRLRVDHAGMGTLLQLPVLFRPAELEAKVLPGSGGVHVFFSLHQLKANTTVAGMDLHASDVPQVGSYFVVAMDFEVKALGSYELPGNGASGTAGLWFDSMTVEQRIPYASASVPIAWSSGQS